MPLPDRDMPWPPPAWGDVFRSYQRWDAWYSGDTDRLAASYSQQFGFNRPSQHAGGVVGRVARWFWGTPQHQERSAKLHIPAAADLAATSADLLFTEPPALSLNDDGDTKTQDRLNDLFGPATTVALIEGAEVASALGGVFLRVGWDRDLADRPILSVVHPDAAVPVFQWGELREVTFYRTVRESDDNVWRHLEHHTPGAVQHGLYLGDRDTLGRPVPLTDDPSTANLAGSVTDDGVSVPTGLDGLDVVYVPNAKPNRRWRNHPQAAPLGRSDLDGVEHLMDALDETYTSWMRDLRLAKARLLVPASYLETAGRGQGATFDTDREIFTELNMLGSKDDMSISAQQFAIRTDEHSATATELWEKVIRGSGYSPQTFGLTGDVAMTATETAARERSTMRTRGKKVRLWRMALARVAAIMLAVDREQFHTGVSPQEPNVEFAPAVTEQPKERADTVKALSDAEAISTRMKVRTMHPDWDDDQIQAEVDAIHDDAPAPPAVMPE